MQLSLNWDKYQRHWKKNFWNNDFKKSTNTKTYAFGASFLNEKMKIQKSATLKWF